MTSEVIDELSESVETLRSPNSLQLLNSTTEQNGKKYKIEQTEQ